MGNLGQLARTLTRRRRRQWQYVSARRRGAVMVLLAALAAMSYAYWYFTNEDRVAAVAEQSLQKMIGVGKVRVHSAKFSLFRGVELKRVSVYARPDDTQSLFHARSIYVRHKPWALLGGRFEPASIVCDRATVTFERSSDNPKSNVEQFLEAMNKVKREKTDKPPSDLPSIAFSNCTFRFIRRQGQMVQTEQKVIHMSMTPRDRTYIVQFRDSAPDGSGEVEGSVEVNLDTGEKKMLSGALPIQYTVIALPDKYLQWCNRYELKGSFTFKGTSGTGKGPGDWDFQLVDASLRLPDAQGGLNLDRVSGHFTMNAHGIGIRNLKGQLRQFGGGWLELNGRYDGFDDKAPFRVELTADDMGFADPAQTRGILQKKLKTFMDNCDPNGSFRVRAVLERAGPTGGDVSPVRLHGQATPRELSMKFKWFPYRVESMRGTLEFDQGGIRFNDAQGRHGATAVRASGQVHLGTKGTPFDVTIRGDNVALDGDLHAAMPKSVRKVWDDLHPAGKADTTVVVHRSPGQRGQNIAVTIRMGGEVSVTYKEFAYPLESLRGQVKIVDRDITLESVTGSSGAMRCGVGGTISQAGKPELKVDLDVWAKDLPLDAALWKAIGPAGQRVVSSLDMQGAADVSGKLTRQGEQKLQYDLRATLAGVDVTAKEFPYRLSGARGAVHLTNGKVTLDGVTGQHGQSRISVSGDVVAGAKRAGVKLTVKGSDVAMDKDLYQALPPRAQRLWKQLSPAGKADITAVLTKAPDSPDEMGYDLTIEPRGMEVTYGTFPYTFRNVEGRVQARPGRVDIQEIISTTGKTSAYLSGVITTKGRTTTALLSMSAHNLPLQDQFIKAMPREFGSLTFKFKPGGSCSVEIGSLSFTRVERESTTAPASTPASGPEKAPPADTTWSCTGTVSFDKARLDVGQRPKTFTGKVSGAASKSAAGLAIKGDVTMDEIVVGTQRLTEFTAHVEKAAKAQVLHIDDVSTKTYGGMIAGKAEVRLGQNIQYAMRLDVEGIDLAQLVNEGVKDPARQTKIKGKLAGRIDYSATPGSTPARQATGQIWITQAAIGKLPVMLGMLNVLYLAMPGDAAFTSGDLTYHLRDDKLSVQEVYFTGEGLSVLGSGTMNMKSEKLDLRFLTGPPGKMPRIALLSELLETISASLTEIRVGGTLKSPKMRTVAFRGVNEFLHPKEGR